MQQTHAIVRFCVFMISIIFCYSYQMDCRQYFHQIMNLILKSIWLIQRNCQFITFMNHKGSLINEKLLSYYFVNYRVQEKIVFLSSSSLHEVPINNRLWDTSAVLDMLTMLSVFIIKVLAKEAKTWLLIQYNIFTSFDWAEGEERSKNWKTTWLPWSMIHCY